MTEVNEVGDGVERGSPKEQIIRSSFDSVHFLLFFGNQWMSIVLLERLGKFTPIGKMMQTCFEVQVPVNLRGHGLRYDLCCIVIFIPTAAS